MKKFTLLLSFTFLLLPFTLYSISIESFTTAIDKQTEKKESREQQIAFLETLHTLLTSPNFQNSPYHQMFTELSYYSYEKMQLLKSQPSESIIPVGVIRRFDGTDTIAINNVNAQQVREAVLGRHNTERIKIGVNPYQYHSDLELSASTRANVLRNEARISNTHTRKSGDGYYNYTSIMEWFNNL